MLLDRNDAGVSGVLSSQSLEHGVESCCMNRGASISLWMRLQLPVCGRFSEDLQKRHATYTQSQTRARRHFLCHPFALILIHYFFSGCPKARVDGVNCDQACESCLIAIAK